MYKKVDAYRVTNLSKVNKTLYKEGDIFITDRSIGILANNKIETVGNKPDLSNYPTKNEVSQMIAEAMNNDSETE